MGRVAAREVEEAAEPEDRAVGKEEVVKEGVSMGVREAAVTAAVKVAEAAAVAREVVVREAGGEGGGGVVPHPDRHGTDGGGRAYGDTLTYLHPSRANFPFCSAKKNPIHTHRPTHHLLNTDCICEISGRRFGPNLEGGGWGGGCETRVFFAAPVSVGASGREPPRTLHSRATAAEREREREKRDRLLLLSTFV